MQAGYYYAGMALECDCGGIKMLHWGGNRWMEWCGEVLY